MNYVLEGQAWPGTTITWSFATTTYPGDLWRAPFSSYMTAAQAQVEAVVIAAFARWSGVSGLTFVQVPDGPSGHAADIRIGWANFTTTNSKDIGLTVPNSSNAVFSPDVLVEIQDPAEVPLVADSGVLGGLRYSPYQSTFYQVVLHEIGHALGLGHPTDPNSVMYPTAMGVQNQDLDATDIAGINAIYAPLLAYAAMVQYPADLNGDGTDDVLFRDTASGSLGEFVMQSGKPTWVNLGWADPGLQVVGLGACFGGRTSDILFRDPVGGGLGQFVMVANHPTWASIGWADPAQKVVGTGDFNGDGTSDILFRNTVGGGLGQFVMHNGQPTWAAIGWADPRLKVVGVGDFNGDGTSDILFRDPLGGGLSEFVMHNGQPTWASIGWADPVLQVVGVGDFNGDGTDDILFRDPLAGTFSDFLMHNGQPTWSSVATAGPNLLFVGDGDYNGDGTSDILLRDPAGGSLTLYAMHNNRPTSTSAGWAAANWHVTG